MDEPDRAAAKPIENWNHEWLGRPGPVRQHRWIEAGESKDHRFYNQDDQTGFNQALRNNAPVQEPEPGDPDMPHWLLKMTNVMPVATAPPATAAQIPKQKPPPKHMLEDNALRIRQKAEYAARMKDEENRRNPPRNVVVTNRLPGGHFSAPMPTLPEEPAARHVTFEEPAAASFSLMTEPGEESEFVRRNRLNQASEAIRLGTSPVPAADSGATRHSNQQSNRQRAALMAATRRAVAMEAAKVKWENLEKKMEEAKNEFMALLSLEPLEVATTPTPIVPYTLDLVTMEVEAATFEDM